MELLFRIYITYYYLTLKSDVTTKPVQNPKRQVKCCGKAGDTVIGESPMNTLLKV